MTKQTRENLILTTILILVVLLWLHVSSIAYALEASPFEVLIEEPDHNVEFIRINREKKLENFFTRYNSPLADSADQFVETADKYGLDYRLLPAIACMESSCAKYYIRSSYNVFGWGIYGSNVIYFESFDDGIETVGKGIYEGYVVKGADTPEKIAPIYTPPNHVKWLQGVRFFMNQIKATKVENSSV